MIDTRQIVVDPAATQTLYLGTNGRGVYKSTDGAQSWTSVFEPTGVVTCLLAVAGPPTTLYACVQGMGIQASSDGGQTWADVSSGLPTEDIFGLALDPMSGTLYATSGAGVFAKTGTSPWADLGSASCLPPVANTSPVIVSRATGRSLVVGAGGMVYAHPL
jgi:hypothetical protein